MALPNYYKSCMSSPDIYKNIVILGYTMKTEYITSAAKPEQLPAPSLPEYALIGRSNVGKSSLINALLNHTGLARTSRTPGRTQMANFFRVDDAIFFVDLPGYGFAAQGPRDHDEWQNLMDGYLARPSIRNFVFLWDPRRELAKIDYLLIRQLSQQAPIIFVMTKCDKLNRSDEQKQRAMFSAALKSKGVRLQSVHAVSTLKKKGVEELRTELLETKI